MAGSREAPPAEPVLTPGEKEAQRFAIADTVVLEVTAGEVRSGQSLSHILAPAGVSAAQLHRMATDQKAVFDVRRMKAGNGWSLFSGPDGAPRHFAYTISSKEYVVFDLYLVFYIVPNTDADVKNLPKFDRPRIVMQHVQQWVVVQNFWCYCDRESSSGNQL